MVPQSVDAIRAVPHPPPRFDLTSFPPFLIDVPILTLYRQGSKDAASTPPCHCEIDIPPSPALYVLEDDPTVDLRVRWFIDYNLSVPRSLAPWPGSDQPLPGTFNDAKYLRRPLPKFVFDADSANIVTNGTHTVEVVVGERDGFDDSPTAPLPNRSMKTGYDSAVYKFVIDVHVEQTIQTCPTDPPSVRLCP